MAEQQHQQTELGRRKRYDDALFVYKVPCHDVELPAAEEKRGVSVRRSPVFYPARLSGERRAAQQRAYPRDELARVEGFAEIIVAADLEADDLVGDIFQRRQEDYRNGAVRRSRGPQAAAEGETVFARHHDVKQDEVEGFSFQRGEEFGAVLRRLRIVAVFAERLRDQLAQLPVVVDDQYSRLFSLHL